MIDPRSAQKLYNNDPIPAKRDFLSIALKSQTAETGIVV
jgi:hypothetical protein